MLRYAAGIVIAGIMAWGLPPAQPAPCGPNSQLTKAQLARHTSAITVARQIKIAEADRFARTKRYVPLPELPGVTVPNGFEPHVLTDGSTYMSSVKDAQDTCKFAVFSDQNGLIYTAAPLQTFEL